MRDEDVEPLYSVPDLRERVNIWRDVSNRSLITFVGDLSDWTFMAEVFSEFRPDHVIHYAEQPSAPFSMLSRELPPKL